MNQGRKNRTRLTVRFTKRDDGGLRAYCDSVPGFYLSGIDKRAVMRDVIPALKALLKVNYEIDVDVSPLGYGIYQLTEKDQSEEEWPDKVEYTRDYLVEQLVA